MTDFFQGDKREIRRDGEALVEWDLEGTDITIEGIRKSLRRKKGKDAAIIKPFRAKRKTKHPMFVSGDHTGNTKNMLSLTSSLKKSMKLPAGDVPVVREFCDKVGLDPSTCTVGDVVIQCQLYFALSGSAPHFMHLFDRIEGKVPQQTEIKMDGKVGISEAMASMLNNRPPDELEYEESDEDHMEMLTGCKNADASVVEDDEECGATEDDAEEDLEDEDSD